MSLDLRIIFYYLYSFIVLFIFIRNCRNWAFLRVTLLYYFFITAFACLLTYGSAYNLESHLAQIQQQGVLAVFPFTFSGGRPGATTIPRSDSNYFLWSIVSISFFVTFPQAVARAARLRLSQSQSPKTIIENIHEKYDTFREKLNHIGNIVLPTVNDFYIIGEWVFILIAISSLVSPFHPYSWYLMLLGCLFILLLTGTDITLGVPGPFTKVLRYFAPGIISKLRNFSAAVLVAIILVVSVAIALFSGLLVLSTIEALTHTKSPGTIAWIIVAVVFLGVLWISCTYLSKAIEFIIAKLIEWMDIK